MQHSVCSCLGPTIQSADRYRAVLPLHSKHPQSPLQQQHKKLTCPVLYVQAGLGVGAEDGLATGVQIHCTCQACQAAVVIVPASGGDVAWLISAPCKQRKQGCGKKSLQSCICHSPATPAGAIVGSCGFVRCEVVQQAACSKVGRNGEREA